MILLHYTIINDEQNLKVLTASLADEGNTKHNTLVLFKTLRPEGNSA